MPRAESLIVGLIASLVLSFVVPASISHAGGPRRCDHKGLSKKNLAKVHAPAIAATAGHRLDWSTLNGCTNSNGAWAHIDIVSEPRADSSIDHGAAWCYIDLDQLWKCDYASGREFDMSVVIGGKTRTLHTDIPPNITVEVAKRVMQEAIDLAPGMEIKHHCWSERASGPVRDSDLESLEAIHLEFQFAESDPFARISNSSAGDLLIVHVGNNELDFEPDRPGSDSFRFKCWSPTISV